MTLKVSQLRALREVADATGASASELIRRALDAFLADRVASYVPGPLRGDPGAQEAGLAASTSNS